MQRGTHEEADALVSDTTQVGDITQKLKHLGVGLIIVGMNQHVAMPTTAETTVSIAHDFTNRDDENIVKVCAEN